MRLTTQKMLDARIRLAMLIMLTVFFGMASHKGIIGIFLVTAMVSYLNRDSFIRGMNVIFLSLFVLGLLMFVARFLKPDISISFLFAEYTRLGSLIVISVVLFSSMNVMDMVSSLVYFKVPIRISLSLGIALRYLHIIYDDSQRIFIIQRNRGITFSPKALKRYGATGLLERLTSPLLVSVLRRADAISLSIAVQQLEKRLSDYKFPPLKNQDYIAMMLLLIGGGWFIFFAK